MKQVRIFCICMLSSFYLGSHAQEFTTPEECGYTKLKSNVIEGISCDHYLENVRTFRPKKGDFISFKEDEYGYEDRAPYDGNLSIGDWRLTLDNGAVCEYKAKSGRITVTFPNGIKLVRTSGSALINLSWRAIKPYDNTPYGPYITAYLEGSQLILPDGKTYNYVAQNKITGFYNKNENRLYNITVDGLFLPTYTLVEGVALKSNKDDVITSYSGGRIKYANGDYLELSNEGFNGLLIKSGSIHRNGGVLTIKEANGKYVNILTYPNGDKYAGDFKYSQDNGDPYYYMGYDRISWHNTLFDALYFPELVPWNGTYISANGKTTQYKDGKTEKERQAEDQAVMAKANALYNGLCKQYGQRYVDAALSQKPIIGMPEKLLKEAFTLKIVEQGTNYAMYRILGWGWKNFGRTLSDTAHLYTVWVQNGRVTDIRYWTNR